MEEEVVRLEEQVVNFRQGLYQEAVYISSKRSVETANDSIEQSPARSNKHQRSKSLSQNEFSSLTSMPKSQPSLARSASSRKLFSPDPAADRPGHCSSRPMNGKQATMKPNPSSFAAGDTSGKENQSCSNTMKDKQSPDKKIAKIVAPGKKLPNKHEEKSTDPLKLQVLIQMYTAVRSFTTAFFLFHLVMLSGGCSIVQLDCGLDQEKAQDSKSGSSDAEVSKIDNSPNKVSEDIVKCLIGIFTRMTTLKDKAVESGPFPSRSASDSHERSRENEFQDPYGICKDVNKRDIGPYKHLYAIEASSIDVSRRTNALFLIHRLK